MSSERFTVFVALETPPCCIMKSLWFQTHFKMIQDAFTHSISCHDHDHVMLWGCPSKLPMSDNTTFPVWMFRRSLSLHQAACSWYRDVRSAYERQARPSPEEFIIIHLVISGLTKTHKASWQFDKWHMFAGESYRTPLPPRPRNLRWNRCHLDACRFLNSIEQHWTNGPNDQRMMWRLSHVRFAHRPICMRSVGDSGGASSKKCIDLGRASCDVMRYESWWILQCILLYAPCYNMHM